MLSKNTLGEMKIDTNVDISETLKTNLKLLGGFKYKTREARLLKLKCVNSAPLIAPEVLLD